MDLNIKGLTALVTGGSRGIGGGIARRLVAEGCNVTLVARDVNALEAMKASLLADYPGADVRYVAADLSTAQGIRRIEEECGNLDILVNSAGAVPRGAISDVTPEQFRTGMESKAFVAIDLAREALRHMEKRRSGVILNIIGVSGERPNPKSVATSTVNAALIAFTEAVGAASPDKNIRVLGINPGLVATERTAGLMKPSTDPNDLAYQNLTASLPFGRMARVEEIADFAAFLVSSRASYCSGCVYSVDAGSRFRV